MVKRILVTGAQGFVGSNVIGQASPDCGLHAISRQPGVGQRPNLHWHEVNILDAAQMQEVFHRVKPDAVIHTAAMANIDECEANQTLARQINIGVTQSLTDLCAASGAKLVLCSTDTVFDGERAPYHESDVPQPINFYAKTKVEAEKIVARLGPNGVIARLALVVGLPKLGTGNSFLAAMIANLKAGRSVGVPPNEIRTPIDVITLARSLNELATGDFSGIFHLAGNESLNRFEMAQRIAVRLGFSSEQIIASDTSMIPNRAPRPRDVSLDNRKARENLKTPMCDFEQGLALALESERMNST